MPCPVLALMCADDAWEISTFSIRARHSLALTCIDQSMAAGSCALIIDPHIHMHKCINGGESKRGTFFSNQQKYTDVVARRAGPQDEKVTKRGQ